MILNRLTPCQVTEIKTPVWNGGQRKVGIATYKIGLHNEIKITAKRKDGTQIYPISFYISGEKARSYPKEPVRSNPSIELYMIPIKDLETLERE